MSVNRYNATTDTMEHIAGNEAIILDEVPTEGSNNAVKSGGVFAELANKANLTQISNPNLLDNPWFTVNQRGQSSYTERYKYTVDRWLNGELSSIDVNSDNTLTLNRSGGTNNNYIYQRHEKQLGMLLNGKVVTLSVLLSDGTIISTSGIYNYNGGYNILNYGDANNHVALTINSVSSAPADNVTVGVLGDGNSITIRAVKLELGSVSTLAMDTAPNYATELLKCQRYFLRIKATAASNWMLFCMVWANSSMNYIINTPAEMRLVPTVSVSNIANFIICKGASTNSRKTGTNINCFGKIGNSIMGTINVSETDLALGDMYVIKAGSADDYINFSADL